MPPMLLAEVTGTVVMSVKHKAFDGEKLLLVQPLDEHGKHAGSAVVAIDRAQAGVGDRVLVLREGSGIRQIVGRDQGVVVAEAVKMDWPVRSMIVGIVDRVDVPVLIGSGSGAPDGFLASGRVASGVGVATTRRAR